MQLYLKIHMDNQWKQNFKEIPFQNRETPARKQLPWCSEAIATDGLLQLSSRGNHRALTGLATVLWGTERRKALCAALGRLAAPGDTHAVARLPGLLRYADWSERKAAVRATGELAERGCGAAVRVLWRSTRCRRATRTSSGRQRGRGHGSRDAVPRRCGSAAGGSRPTARTCARPCRSWPAGPGSRRRSMTAAPSPLRGRRCQQSRYVRYAYDIIAHICM